jgi:E3 ubiquitin-protein ligase CCNP1IP1
MRQKHEKLIEAYKEKSKNQQQTQKLYQTLKQQQFAAGIELVADTDAGHVLHENGDGRRGDSGSDTNLRHYHHDEQRPRAGASDIWPTISKAGANRSGVENSRKSASIRTLNMR